MKRRGSGPARVKAYIWMSDQNLPKVSGLPASDEKNTEAATPFSSMSMPTFEQPCLKIACTFCRTALVEVWCTNFSLRPPFSRTPSLPRFQPAASSSALAFSMLVSIFRLRLVTGAGLFRMLGVATPARP